MKSTKTKDRPRDVCVVCLASAKSSTYLMLRHCWAVRCAAQGSISGSAEAAAAAPAEVVGRLTTLDDKLGGGDLRSLVSIGMHDSARSGGRGLRQVPFHASRAACGDALCPMRRGRSGASTPAMSERNRERERECWWRLRDESLHCMN